MADAMIDCTRYAATLRPEPDGLWVAATSGPVSYPEHGNDVCFQIEDRSFWFQHRNRCITAVVRRHPPTGPIFDVGGGNGFVSLALREAGFPSVVVEPYLSGARHAVSRGLRPVIAASLDDAGFYPRRLPAAGLFDVLEHIEDDVGFLRRLHEALAPGGRLYLTVPAFRMLWSTEDDAAGHFRRYSLATLDAALRAGGFAVDFATYMFAWLPLPVLLFRALPSRLGRRGAPEAERTATEHALPGGLVGRALGGLLDAEYARIAAGRALPLGGSCLVAAHAVG